MILILKAHKKSRTKKNPNLLIEASLDETNTNSSTATNSTNIDTNTICPVSSSFRMTSTATITIERQKHEAFVSFGWNDFPVSTAQDFCSSLVVDTQSSLLLSSLAVHDESSFTVVKATNGIPQKQQKDHHHHHHQCHKKVRFDAVHVREHGITTLLPPPATAKMMTRLKMETTALSVFQYCSIGPTLHTRSLCTSTTTKACVNVVLTGPNEVN